MSLPNKAIKNVELSSNCKFCKSDVKMFKFEFDSTILQSQEAVKIVGNEDLKSEFCVNFFCKDLKSNEFKRLTEIINKIKK